MYILKSSAIICVAALLGANFVSAQTFDPDAQAKAREALRQKLNDVDSTNAAATAANAAAPVAPQVPPADVPVAPQIPVEPPAAPVISAPSAPAVSVPEVQAPAAPARLTPSEEDKLRKAMREAIANSRNTPPMTPAAPAPVAPPQVPAPAVVVTPPTAPAVSVIPAAPAAPVVQVTAPAVQPVFVQTPKTPQVVNSEFTLPTIASTNQLSTEEQQRVIQAMRQQKATLDAKEMSYTPTVGAPSKAPAKIVSQAKNPYMETPAPTPAILVPGSKEQKLFDLLQLYKQDQITPAEYHDRRAKIIAEP